MNPTIAYITVRGMLGRKRALLLFALPAMLLLLVIGLKASDNATVSIQTAVLRQFALSTLLPLLALIAGTGVIGPEIDDGQIMYIMTKPISRPVIVMTKLAVAIALVFAFAVVPTFVAGLILGNTEGLAFAFAFAVLIGGIAYCALFVALAVVSRFAVTIGLIYVLVWEVLIGNLAPGAKNLSIQQWSLSIVDRLTDASTVEAEVSLGTAGILLLVVTVAGALYASVRLRNLTIASAE
ncbi:MAG: ABC transporter permease [Streptosporangiaceae bacterium]